MHCYIRGLKTGLTCLPVVGLSKIASRSCECELACEVSCGLNENGAMTSLQWGSHMKSVCSEENWMEM